jgi:hypothetical protein
MRIATPLTTLLACAALLLLSVTAQAGTGDRPEEYDPAGKYTPGVKYVVSLPSLTPTLKKPSVFSGTFKEFKNPFSGVKAMIPDKGEFRAPGGLRFTGAFDYIPKRLNLGSNTTVDWARQQQASGGGSFVFAGDRFDELAEEGEPHVMSGIFVSLYESPLSSTAFELVEATPDYVQKLAADYRRDLVADVEYQAALKEYAAKVDKAQEEYDRQRLSRFLNFASGALNMFGGALDLTGNLGNVGAFTGGLAGKMDMADMALKVVKIVVTEDQGIGDVLSGAVGDKMKSLLKQAGGGKSDLLIDTLNSMVTDNNGGAVRPPTDRLFRGTHSSMPLATP